MKHFICCLMLAVGSLAIQAPATAHPLAPALLEMHEISSNEYDVLWRLSMLQPSGKVPAPGFPSHCQQETAPVFTKESGTAVASRWRIRCENGGLAGKEIRISHIESTGINVVLRILPLTSDTVEILLDAKNPAAIVPIADMENSAFSRYLLLGMEHLVFGPDHLLFLLALILIVGMKVRLIWTLTAFTLGHSITLSLASLALIHFNAAIMELGIAASLVIAARELLRNEPSWLGRHPMLMAGTFGLLHGLGFAGALSDVGLPEDSLFLALLGFNLGIEAAQILIVAALWILSQIIIRERQATWQLSHLLPAYLIGSLAMLWCLERIGVVWQG